jgi:hypothetical protein
MKYPSLQKVNLIVIDGRSSDTALKVFINGALLALARGFDGHILVATSSSQSEMKYEQLGEQAGLDFFFHSQFVEDSESFLALCDGAMMVAMPSPWPTQPEELAQLRMMNKSVALSKQVSGQTPPWQGAVFFNAKKINALVISSLLTGDFSSTVLDALDT